MERERVHKENKGEERARSISPEHSDLDDGVGDIIERFEAKDEDRPEDSTKKGKVEAEAAKGGGNEESSTGDVFPEQERKG